MKKLFIIFCIAHLLCMIYNNIIIEEQAYYQFFHDKNVKGKALSLLEKSGPGLDLFNIYSDYTGAETGYGFYAPNVSSQFVILYTIKDSLGNTITVNLPQHYTKEALLRYFSAFDTFMEKLDENDPEYEKYLDIMLKSMALKVLEDHPPYRHIDADIMVYDLPVMPEFKKGAKPDYAHLFHYEYKLEG